MTEINKEEFEISIDVLDSMVKEGDSIIGSNLKRLVINKYESDHNYRKIYDNFFSANNKKDTYSINAKVYYFIEDGYNVIRDTFKSPRSYKLLNNDLENMINSDISYSGLEVKRAFELEGELRKKLDDQLKIEYKNKPFEAIYDYIHVTHSRYAPKDNLFYFIRYNTAGKYFIKRDMVKSPRSNRTA